MKKVKYSKIVSYDYKQFLNNNVHTKLYQVLIIDTFVDFLIE